MFPWPLRIRTVGGVGGDGWKSLPARLGVSFGTSSHDQGSNLVGNLFNIRAINLNACRALAQER